jgi:hypothetical protein
MLKVNSKAELQKVKINAPASPELIKKALTQFRFKRRKKAVFFCRCN